MAQEVITTAGRDHPVLQIQHVAGEGSVGLCLTLLAYHRLCLDNTSRFLHNPPKTLPSAQSGNQKNVSAYSIYANSLPGL